MARIVTRQNLAMAFIFLLAVRDVSAARDSYLAGELASLSALSADAKTEQEERNAAVRAAGSFSIDTMWSKGDDAAWFSSLTWLQSEVKFAYKDGAAGDVAQYVEVTGLDKPYRLLPDTVVLNQEINGMSVVGIVGYQAKLGQLLFLACSSHYGLNNLLVSRLPQPFSRLPKLP